MIRRSFVCFVDQDLPAMQVHHGTADPAVDIAHGRRAAEVMGVPPAGACTLGQIAGNPAFSFFEYEGAGHDASMLTGHAACATELPCSVGP